MREFELGLIQSPRLWVESLFSDGDYRGWAIVTAIIVVSVGAFIWAAFVRKRRPDRHFHPLMPRSRHRARHGAAWSLRRLLKAKRRRRRRRALQANPTLAETGGLPPIRPENSPPAVK